MLLRFYRARDWNGFYCVDEMIHNDHHEAITCSGVRKVGKVTRIKIKDETVRKELFEVHWGELPHLWRQAFREYLWRQRSRKL